MNKINMVTSKNKILKKYKLKQTGVRRGKRGSLKNIVTNVVFAGVNPAGARSKWPTWKKSH